MRTWFYRGCGEWQFEFLIGRLQVRIGSQQQAAWWNDKGSRGSYIWLFNFGRRARAIRASHRSH